MRGPRETSPKTPTGCCGYRRALGFIDWIRQLVSAPRSHHRADDPASLSSDRIDSSATDRNGILWVATPEGLDAFDRSTGRVTLHVPLHEPREPREMSDLFEDRAGTFWIVHSSGEGLAVLDRKTGVLTRYSFAERPHGPEDLTGVSSMIEDADGQLWIGTHSDGLLRLDPKGLRATRYRNDPLDPNSLAENRITTPRARSGRGHLGRTWRLEPNHFAPHPGPFRALPSMPAIVTTWAKSWSTLCTRTQEVAFGWEPRVRWPATIAQTAATSASSCPAWARATCCQSSRIRQGSFGWALRATD